MTGISGFLKLRRLTAAVATSGALLLGAPAIAGFERADSNCDSLVNFDDITCFVSAVISQSAWDACGHALGCGYLQVNDINQDGLVNFDDISPFVECVILGGCPTTGQVIDTELAGNPLSSYPFFHYVTAIQNNQPVRVALDPTRFPQIVGQSARIYVVANKTEAQWTSDPSLVDVTAGGFLPVTFAGGTIQANTFTVAAAGELSSAAGVDLGIPYDVVVDMNNNGMLDDGDFIDGRLGTAGGFYYMKNIVGNGPRGITTATYVVNRTQGLPPGQSIVTGSCGGTGADCASQRVYYPATFAPGESLPLIVIAHGNGQHYLWYDYIGQHLATHGFIVMSHANNTTAGVEAAATTTLQHIDAFLGQLPSIAGGVLVGRVDARNQAWIGHSRGGEGVTIAYNRIGRVPPIYTPVSYSAADVKFVSAIAPVDFQGPGSANPLGVNYHLIYGSADGDVSGTPSSDVADSFNLYERATGNRYSTYVHGADHNYFNCCGFRDWAGSPGPDITRPNAQLVLRGAFIAGVMHFIRGDVPSRDYFWRQYEDLRPVGVPLTVPTGQQLTVVNEYKLPVGSPNKAVIDDYQSQASTLISSSGGTVTNTVTLLTELLLNDADSSFTYSASDRAQGMTRARTNDTTRGATFESPAGANTFIEWAIVPALRNFSQWTYLSMRACQITRAPLTIAELADVDFTVTIRDSLNRTGSIRISAYGGGIEEVYQRSGSGTGTGWQNEFETVVIRLTDFLHNGGNVDLSDIVAVRLSFGPAFGSNGLHLGFDDLELTRW